MARGDFATFDEGRLAFIRGEHDAADVFEVALINSIPTRGDATPALGDYTEVTGGSYDSEVATVAITEAAGKVKFDITNDMVWAQDLLGPSDIRAALVYNGKAGNPAIGFVDLTTDGSTPVSLVQGSVSITWNAEGLFTVDTAA